jgi:DNA-binding CsgD family transcriptional regulator
MNSYENLKYSTGMDLGRREAEAVMLAALGYSTKESGRIMNVAACTVKTYLDNARLKLSARNVAHAVSLAWQYGLICSKYLSLTLFIFALLHSALSGDTDQRNTSRPIRTVRTARNARNGKRDGDSNLLPAALNDPDGHLFLSLKDWRSLLSPSRSAA